ncbi:MAG TPA: hypothetical protein VJ867_02725 [Gemmatimonadaceae bacterium]|nr:hypothetical protein [Gemmatimonadaceae bacterium]
MRPLFVCAMTSLVLLGCDRRPTVVDSTGALAAVGSTIPDFKFPSIRGWTFERKELALGHTLIALVPANATGDEPGLVAFDSLKRENLMFRFAVMFPRAVSPADTHYLNEPQWRWGAAKGYASDTMQLIAAFAPGVLDTSDKHVRHVLAYPSFMIVSDSGRVLGRSVGSPMPLKPIMDSLRALWTARTTAEANAELARARGPIERGVQTFDPVTLTTPDSAGVSLFTCGGEETVTAGIIPAWAHADSILVRNPGVVSYLEVVSVADLEPTDELMCTGKPMIVTPRVATRRYRLDFFWSNATYPSTDGRGAWRPDMTASRIGGDPSTPEYVAVLGLQDSAEFRLPAGVTIVSLRKQIDSVRAARATPK